MLEKLRSRHSIDLPVESWGRSRGLMGTLGAIALLFLGLPLLGVLAWAAWQRQPLYGMALAGAAFVLVFVVWGAWGKAGHRRR